MLFSTGAGTTSVFNLLGPLTPAAGGNPDVTLAAPVFNLYRNTNTSMTTPDATCAGVVSSTGVVSCSLTGVGIDNWTVVLQLPGTDGYFTARASDPIVVTVYQPTAGELATRGGWVGAPGQLEPTGADTFQIRHANAGFTVRS